MYQQQLREPVRKTERMAISLTGKIKSSRSSSTGDTRGAMGYAVRYASVLTSKF